MAFNIENTAPVTLDPPDAWDLSLIKQMPGELECQYWSRFLSRKNEIPNCRDEEALIAFRIRMKDE